ncbi:MAG: aminotransferase class IV, partial [Bacillota bacterium]|nr:aminotransferase class IV [Bacillota bacterium]
SGILPGITRQEVIDICRTAEIPLVEKKLLPEDLYNADECFITNSLAEILPICWIEDNQIGQGIPGNMTKAIHEKYILMVNEIIGNNK